MPHPKLTICILTIARRYEKLVRLQKRLIDQCEATSVRTSMEFVSGMNSKAEIDLLPPTWLSRITCDTDVEILTYCTPLWDRKDHSLSVGAKRNHLIANALGDYVSFVDDDDLVSDRYVAELLHRIPLAPDVITFKAHVFLPGKPLIMTTFGPFAQDRSVNAATHERLPNHLCAWRRSLCLLYGEGINGEDTEWAHRMRASVRPGFTFAHVDKVLYEYHWNPHDSVQLVSKKPSKR